MNTAWLICGQVMHQRLRPVQNRFVYPVFYVRINIDHLAELDQFWFGINRWRPVALYERDYTHKDGSSIAVWIRQTLHEANLDLDGEIWLQTFPRILGFAFNPVSFWYCHDREGKLRAILADVSNTFGERHRYLLTAPGVGEIDERSELVCRKMLHVSPFCCVEGNYHFRVRDTSHTVFTGVDYYDGQGLLIRTAVGGHRAAFTPTNLARVFFRQPMLTLGVVLRIHAQALRLWLRRVPIFTKPTPPFHSLTQASHKRPEP